MAMIRFGVYIFLRKGINLAPTKFGLC